MTDYRIVDLRSRPDLAPAAARWFHRRWNIPLEAYEESMAACLAGAVVPQWYLAMAEETIVGGMGVIENDFHDRPDLRPNVCAVYTDPAWRCRGIAGALLEHVCADMKARGVDTLYLITEHTSFYERCGWEFYCMVQGDGESHKTRMYIHRS